MSLMTTALASRTFDGDPEYAEGRADAYDDAELLTLDQLAARAAEYGEHADLPRAFGYMDTALEYCLGRDAVIAAETELAYTVAATR